LDDDAKVQSVMHDALVAGDVDASLFEEALSADTIMRWIDLSDWWTFWRGGKITKFTILKALESAYELGLFDADWFLASVRGQGGKLRGTDVLAEGLNKADLTEWVRRIHESGDGSPKGLLAALGWDQIVAKTADDVLVSVLDAMALKVSLAKPPDSKGPEDTEPPRGESKGAEVLGVGAKGDATVEATAEGKTETVVDAKADASKSDLQPAVDTEPKPPADADPKPPPSADPKPPASVAKPPPISETKSPAWTGAKVGANLDGKSPPPFGASAPPASFVPGMFATGGAVGAEPSKGPPPLFQGNEESIDSESAAHLFKDDELIPISSGAWDDVSEVEEDETLPGVKSGSPPPRNSRKAK
jgi:hypothetical protein